VDRQNRTLKFGSTRRPQWVVQSHSHRLAAVTAGLHWQLPQV